MTQISDTIPENQSLKWRFDVNTFRLLGRELITDRITAVYELVKNCYDANATEVKVDFYNVIHSDKNGIITISDNGTGMSFVDIRDKWMVVGTNSKRSQLYSEPPFNRKFVGEKGIGRFAVDKLGERVQIRTKQKGDKKWLCINIYWDEYEQLSTAPQKNGQLSLFTEIENKYTYDIGNENEHGTQIIINKISEGWTEIDIERLYKELSKLVSPFYPVYPPFNITVNSNDFKDYSNKPVSAEPIKYYSHHAEIGFDIEKKEQETLTFNNQTGKIEIQKVQIQKFGPVKIKMYYFNESAKRKYNAIYKNNESRLDGIKIYRDGIITTPFAEYETELDKRRDILGLDKRKWSGTFDTIGTREIIGIVDITKDANPRIIDATNRQDFIANDEYGSLKEFILEQLSTFEKIKVFERTAKRSNIENKLIAAGSDVKIFEKELIRIESELENANPEAKKSVTQLREQARQLHEIISKGIGEQKKFQKEVERKEKILYSIVSMQEYASMIAHAVRTSIAKVKHFAEFMNANYPDPTFNSYYKLYATSIYNEMNTLISVTDFMLSFASSDSAYEEFSVSDLIKDLLQNQYNTVFRNEGISLEIDFKDDFIIDTNKKAFQDIFQNLVSNSIKALKNIIGKKIKCTGFLNTDNFVIYFSDNGLGIDIDDRDWIFGLYNTRTAELGGAGVGLYIVEKQIKALNGTIEVIDNEFKPTGATFKITIPFNK